MPVTRGLLTAAILAASRTAGDRGPWAGPGGRAPRPRVGRAVWLAVLGVAPGQETRQVAAQATAPRSSKLEWVSCSPLGEMTL